MHINNLMATKAEIEMRLYFKAPAKRTAKLFSC